MCHPCGLQQPPEHWHQQNPSAAWPGHAFYLTGPMQRKAENFNDGTGHGQEILL
jgi:hypothetical protein